MAVGNNDYTFTVYANSLNPFGPVGKENLDVLRLRYDFTCYLDPSEGIDLIQFPTIGLPATVQDGSSGSWRQDYPPDDSTTGSVPPADTYPLAVVSQAIESPQIVDIRLNAGTPGFQYVMSFLIVGSSSRRRKQVDTLINVEPALNPAMSGPGQLDPDIVPPIVVSGSIALPMGFDGLVIMENTSSLTGLVVTLPPNPELGQEVEYIDKLGTDGACPVTFRGDGDVPIDGDGSLTFLSITAYEALRFVWTGTYWHLESVRFGFLA
jgi:hypothetical protein